jgi:tRNA-2-methylthio-N6-dimethylallyladenosine synthase
MLKYHLATYGCQMNEYDSNMVAAMLEDRGFAETDRPDNADLVIVNTCSVRGKAEENLYQRIHLLRPLKDAKPDMRIAVIGCMAENHGEKILKALKHVDVVAGPDQYKKLVELVAHPVEVKSRKRRVPVLTGFDIRENYADDFAKIASPFSTHITIQRGCNKRCAYCIVPFTRGQEKYRPAIQILEEVRHAVGKGIKEISLLGQTVNSYRTESDSFASLLTRVSEVPGVERIRFMSPHPRHYNDALLDVLANNPKICRHAHLPLQSGSNSILEKMRRQYDVEDFLNIVERLRKIDPNYGLSTDVIVGFTGETDADFRETLAVMRQVQFDSAFMFSYSPREGTEAFPWTETLSEEQKSERLQELIDLQHSVTVIRNRAMIGSVESVLLERPSSRNLHELVGKTGNFKKVVLEGSAVAKAGDIVRAKITDLRGWTLRGELA